MALVGNGFRQCKSPPPGHPCGPSARAAVDFIRDHIRYVTPLYLERLHIIYDHGAYTKVYQKMFGSSSDISPPSLGTSASVHKAVKTFFQQSKVSTGPVGSASRIFASYLRDVCEIGPFRDEGLHFAEALDSLMHEDDGIDIVFSMAGAPLVRVRGALQTREEDGGKDLRLMSIESALVPELNGRYGVKLRGSTFKDKYDGYDNTSTIGSYAFLVTSKDVPNLAVMELLSLDFRQGPSQGAGVPLSKLLNPFVDAHSGGAKISP